MLTLLRFLAGFIPSASAAQLQNTGSSNPGVAAMWAKICSVLPFCSLGAESAPQYFTGKVIFIVQSLVTSVAIMMILYAAILMSTTQLDEGRLDEAKNIIKFAVIGLVLSVIAGAMMQYLLSTVFPQIFQ
jgi:hypothetical protein